MRSPTFARRSFRPSQGAFTFHEALLAIALVGILSAIALPIMSQSHDESRTRVLHSNVRQMNDLLREAHRFGGRGTRAAQIKGSHAEATVADVCVALTTGHAVYVDKDADQVLDPHEFAFEMDLPPNADPYQHLIGQFQKNGYEVRVQGDAPVQLAIYLNGVFEETP